MYIYPIDPKEDQHFYSRAAYAALFSSLYSQSGGHGLVWGEPLRIKYDNGNVTHTFHNFDLHPSVTAGGPPEFSE